MKTPSSPSKGRTAPAPAGNEADGRERILEVAIHSFAERGYAGTTTAGIAREAGVTQPLVHHHFRSKEGLWRAAVDHLFGELPAFVSGIKPEGSPEERILAIVDGFVRLSATRPDIARIIAREGAAPGPRLDYLLSRYVGVAFEHIVSLLRQAQQAGSISPEVRPELLLFFVLGAGGHLFDVPALARGAFGLDTTSDVVREEFVALFHRILRHGVISTRDPAPPPP
jgi:TetR/AcrR family transcriptional regulator